MGKTPEMIAIARRPVWHERSLVFGGLAAGALLAALLALAVVDTLRQLHAMTAQLATVAEDLGTLDVMSRKLDRLATMQATLGRTNGKLDETNRRLDGALSRLRSTQATLGSMDSKLGGLTGEMHGLDRDLRSMRGDIHVMAHKVGGSFLFRNVK
jgi:ABC-type transporter Mla subunit MlaD